MTSTNFKNSLKNKKTKTKQNKKKKTKTKTKNLIQTPKLLPQKYLPKTPNLQLKQIQ